MARPVFINLEPRDLERCRGVIRKLLDAIAVNHGLAVAQRLFAEEVPLNGRNLQKAKNDRLLAEYVRSGLSIKRCAAVLAEKNGTLPAARRHGPNGTTNAETLDKQIRRQKKLMDRDPRYQKYIRRLAWRLGKYGLDIS
jgi:hypothetical protein